MRVVALATLMCAAAPQALAQAAAEQPPATTEQPVLVEQPAEQRPQDPAAQTATPEATPATRSTPSPGSQAQTQPGGAAGVLVYTPDFFAASRPAHAWDMIGRLPGFQFESGSSARGFAGTAGNVLIDGKRPASKSDSLSDILTRIPASQVERIEIIRGGAAGVDMQGRTVVANVIRKTADSFQQTVNVYTHWFLNSGHQLPGFRYDAARKAGERSWDFSFSRLINFDDSTGNGRRVRRDAAGLITREEISGNEGDGEGFTTRGSFGTPLFGGELRLNASLTDSPFKYESHFLRTDGRQDIVENSDSLTGEVGANYTRPLATGWSLETVLLQKLGRSDGEELFEATPDTVELFTSQADTGESIGRAVLKHQRSETLSFEAGGEAAFNFREGHAQLVADGENIEFPSSDVRVEERRGELFALANWRPSPRFSAEVGSRFEASTISVTDLSGEGADREKSFFYPKPRVVLSWTPIEKSQLRFRLEREVGQLNFGDFVSSANLTDGKIVAGNPDLEPTKSWVLEAVAERRFWDTGAITLTFRHAQLTDAIDRIPIFQDEDANGVPDDEDGDGIPDGVFDAPGNIGDGRDDRIVLNVTLPLKRFGVTGGELKADILFRDSEVTDPTTGEKRRISGQRPDEIEFNYRHDMPARKLTFTANYYYGWEEHYYRFNEIQDYNLRHFAATSLEYKPDPKTSWFVEVANFTRFQFDRRRRVFEGPRDVSPLAFDELYSNRSQVRAYLRLRRVFGD